MVNEFVSLSPKRQSKEDCCYREKAVVSESSDEDTTSSSLMPIPDTLDVMRNELKSTINNLGTMDYVASPKPNDFTLKNMHLDVKHPTEREVSIARKITSANLLLDDLLNASNILPRNVKDKNPLVFAAKTVRQRPSSESSDPSTGSVTSSENHCPVIPVAAFAYSHPICDCSRYPSEKPDPVPTEPVEENPGTTVELKQPEKEGFLLKKVRSMRWRCKKDRKRLVDNSQQTKPNAHPQKDTYPSAQYPNADVPFPTPNHRLSYQGMNFSMNDHRQSKKCTCSEEKPPECTCRPVELTSCECNTRKKTKDAKCGSDDAPEFLNSNGSADAPEDERIGIRVPLVPMTVRAKTKERIDVYYFDHGNSSYYKTTDSHRARYTEYMLERTDEYATKFWAEVFGTVTIAIAFIVSFILQLYRCVFTAVIRALTVGLIQIFSDYFFKPLLTVLFNGLIQPCLILGYNIATSTRDFCVPVCEICEFCAKDLAIIFGSCRLVEVKQRECSSPSCQCRHNV